LVAKGEKAAKSDAKDDTASSGDLDLDAALKKIDDEDAGLKADIQANRGAADKGKAAAKLKLAQEGDDTDLEKIAAEFQKDKAQAQGLTAKFEKIPKKGVAAEESPKVVEHKSPKGKLLDSEDEDEEGKCQVSDDNMDEDSFKLGLPKTEFLPISFEIEMFSKKGEPNMERGQPALKWFNKQITETMKDMKNKVKGKCPKRLFQTTANSKEEDRAWVVELEKDEWQKGFLPIIFETASPINLDEDEAEVAIAATSAFQDTFQKVPSQQIEKAAINGQETSFETDFYREDPPGTHVHVISNCLKSDERRLVALLLIWEKFGKAVYERVHSNLHRVTPKAGHKAARINFKTPELLAKLREYLGENGFKTRAGDDDATITELFKRYDSPEGMNGDKSDADGYRRFEVNVCHLIDVKCAHNLPKKNAVPKFGGIEFRGFDPLVGKPLRMVVMLVQRLVQLCCGADLDKVLFPLAKMEGDADEREDDIGPLLKALQIDEDTFAERKFKSQAWDEGGK